MELHSQINTAGELFVLIGFQKKHDHFIIKI